MFSIGIIEKRKAKKLYQWDIDRQIRITAPEDIEVNEVHFAHQYDKEALVVRTKNADGELVANIPNILLQSYGKIRVWLVSEDQTVFSDILIVIQRAKPADYVYAETEVLRYESLEARIKALEENGGGEANIDLGEYVKNTDYATKDVAGVAKIYGTADKNAPGVGLTGNNVLGIVPASTANIGEKATSKPIVPTNLDYAVKSAMTTNALEWTEKEKQSARDLIGAESKETWTTLLDVTLEEDVNTIEVTTDMDGNPFKAKKMRLTFLGIMTDARLNMHFPSCMQNTYFYNAFKSNNNYSRVVVEIGEKLSNGMCRTELTLSGDKPEGVYTLSGNYYSAISTRLTSYLDGIKMNMQTDKYFTAGTRILVEGVLES